MTTTTSYTGVRPLTLLADLATNRDMGYHHDLTADVSIEEADAECLQAIATSGHAHAAAILHIAQWIILAD